MHVIFSWPRYRGRLEFMKKIENWIISTEEQFNTCLCRETTIVRQIDGCQKFFLLNFYKVFLIKQKYLLRGYSKWRQIKLQVSTEVYPFLWLRNASWVKITERMCNVNGNACFCWKMFTNGVNMGLPQPTWVRKTVHGMEICWLSGKEKVPGAQSVKKVMLILFLDIKGPVSIDFLEKSATVYSSSNCLILGQNSSYLFNDLRIYIYIWK